MHKKIKIFIGNFEGYSRKKHIEKPYRGKIKFAEHNVKAIHKINKSFCVFLGFSCFLFLSLSLKKTS